MCDFLSLIIRRDGRIFGDGVHGHAELARRYINGENGIGHQRYWEWELTAKEFINPDTQRLGIQNRVNASTKLLEILPDPVCASSDSIEKELSELNGISSTFPWLAVLRDGVTDYLSADVRIVVLCNDAELKYLDGIQIAYLYHSSKVVEMHHSSKVVEMYDSSKVVEMHDSSKVGKMYGSSEVVEMHHSSKVVEMHHSSKVGKMHHSSEVVEMYDSSKVVEMYDSSKVGKMHDSSKVEINNTEQ